MKKRFKQKMLKTAESIEKQNSRLDMSGCQLCDYEVGRAASGCCVDCGFSRIRLSQSRQFELR
jgi:hypothetical protein